MISLKSGKFGKSPSKAPNQKVNTHQASKKSAKFNQEFLKYDKKTMYKRKNKLSFIITAKDEKIKFNL